jgi:hypothetical protein
VSPGPLVWDGEGQDPWLPYRLDALLNAAEAERSIHEIVWDRLSSWLVATSRRVLRGPAPEPDRIFAQVPAWEQDIADIISLGILPVMSWAYEAIFGPGEDWKTSKATLSYLTGVRNRLVRTPEEVFDMVAGQVAAGVTLGEGIPELTVRVDEVLSVTHTERWANRAVTIARTETLGALNDSRTGAFQQLAADDDEEDYERMWLATLDARTRPTHQAADGQRVPVNDPFIVGGVSLMSPGSPDGPAQEVINCLPADAIVEFGSVRAVTRRWFEGEMVTIHFATGDVLTITPNHPVLRADGQWTPAGLLNEGQYCVRAVGRDRLLAEPDEDGGPSQIGEVYRSASETQLPDRVRLSPPDLHGDAADGDVEVVSVHGDLSFYGQPATDEEVHKFGLSLANTARLRQRSRNGRLLPGRIPWSEADFLRAPLGISGSGELAPLLGSEPGHPKAISLAASAGSQIKIPKAPGHNVAVDAQGPRDSENTFPADVATAKIVKVDRSVFSGHVFNLDTGVGWYIANGITVRNCRCTTLLLEAGEVLDMSNRQFRRK